LEEPEAVPRAVTQHEGPGRVLRAGHPDLVLDVVPGAAGLDAERLVALAGDALEGETERPVEPLRRPVLDRDRADDAVPAAGESRGDGLRDLEVPVRLDPDGGLEPLDDEAPLSRRRRRRERRESAQPPASHSPAPTRT